MTGRTPAGPFSTTSLSTQSLLKRNKGLGNRAVRTWQNLSASSPETGGLDCIRTTA